MLTFSLFDFAGRDFLDLYRCIMRSRCYRFCIVVPKQTCTRTTGNQIAVEYCMAVYAGHLLQAVATDLHFYSYPPGEKALIHFTLETVELERLTDVLWRLLQVYHEALITEEHAVFRDEAVAYIDQLVLARAGA